MRIRSLAAFALFLALGASEAAFAESALTRSLQRSVGKSTSAQPSEVVIVMRYNVARKTRPDANALAAAQRMAEFISKQPGFLDGQILRNVNASQRPDFLHVTRWQSFADWERLFTTPAVIAAFDRESPVLSATGSAFVPVRLQQ